MAKIKQKKLKAENFRYVTKEIIKDPMIYLDDFFVQRTRIENWERDIHLLVNAAVCSELANPQMLESGFNCNRLIEQVEVAYIIYKQCNLKKQAKPLKVLKKRKDYLAYWFRGEYTFNGKADPADTLSRFFSYQSLAGWYKTLDDMMMYLADHTRSHEERFGDKIVVIRELLLRMARALSDIYENEGISVQVPSYFVACQMVKDEERNSTSLAAALSDDLSEEEGDSYEEEADESAAFEDEPETRDESDDLIEKKENHQTEEA